ncbi:hypothetical protein Daesc_004932 [Daldinia eschscholtzii]|uniref:Heterokaryon incompatibility domain-containing protein n=1 Tax=Daldinia eschscholtzii TaxID=292717 RepID=A0AAX6MKD4_9PEZI
MAMLNYGKVMQKWQAAAVKQLKTGMTINSMYRWYADSCVCYAYLSDVGTGNIEGSKFILDPSELSRIDPGDDTQLTSAGPTTTFGTRSKGYFKESRWFTRGWTLQELIAPRRIKFYSEEWVELGTKTNLREIITKVTGISEDVLLGYTALSDITVALKMSWAANRSTTREEDMAYCLMGLFDINMPLLYGEGTKAFKRLQEEIMHRYEDYTILLCNGLNWDIFLADSPADFSSQIMHDPYWTFDPKINVRDDHSIEMDLRKLHNQIELPMGASSIFEDSSHAAMSLTSRGVHVALLFVVALTLPRREEDTSYVFLVGNLNQHDWCLVMHEVSQQIPDREYMDSVLRIWNLKGIAKPEVASRLTKNITIPLTEREMLSISQEFNGYNDITIQVSVDKIEMEHLVKKETRAVSSQPLQVPQSILGTLDRLIVSGSGGEEKVNFDPKSALRKKKRRMLEMTTRPVKHQRLS